MPQYYTKSKEGPAFPNGRSGFLAWGFDPLVQECNAADKLSFVAGITCHCTYQSMYKPQACMDGANL